MMGKKDVPSYADLVHEVLRLAERPLTVAEILREVDSRRAVNTRDPQATIRTTLGQGRQLVSLGDGRYGYLPNLLNGSLLRLPLLGKRPANQPLVLPVDVHIALWPDWLDLQKRKLKRTVVLRLPKGEEVALAHEHLGHGTWGSPMPELLRRFLVDNRAGEGSSLLITAVDASRGRYEVRYEPRVLRDETAISRRNREIVDAVCAIVRRNPSYEFSTTDLAVLLPARGYYRREPAPDSLDSVLGGDPRIVDAGYGGWRLSSTLTPEIEALIKRRKQLEASLGRGDARSEQDSDEPLGILDFRRSMERSLLDVGAFLAKRRPRSAEEANNLLGDVMTSFGPSRRKLDSLLDRAQELMYDAWGSRDSRERVRLARKALTICPDCADAYVLLAEDTARDASEAAELYAKGVAAGKRGLGEEGFKKYAGGFWGVIETRPYMRARSGLARSLWLLKKRREAIAHVWDMLGLNPGDNQGMRYILLGWLLEIADEAGVKKLLEKYPKDIVASWAYGRALHAYRTQGDSERARELRATAVKVNSFAPDYLTGRKRLPRELPERVGFGDESEAMTCAEEQLAAWRQTPGAVAWLSREDDRPGRGTG